MEFQSAIKLLTTRLLIVVFMALLAFISSKNDLKIIVLRNVFVGLLLILWYPETFDINRSLINYDHLLAYWEQFIFSCQPALLFSHKGYSNMVLRIDEYGLFCLLSSYYLYQFVFLSFDIKYFKYFYFTVLMSFLFII